MTWWSCKKNSKVWGENSRAWQLLNLSSAFIAKVTKRTKEARKVLEAEIVLVAWSNNELSQKDLYMQSQYIVEIKWGN